MERQKADFYRQLANVTTPTPIITDQNDSLILLSSSESPEAVYYEEECTFTCELTNDKGYVLYSAFGSFFIPTFIMMFFYWRIYRAAVETTRAINQGFRTTKGSRLLGSRFKEERLTLRIHRGASRSSAQQCPNSPKPILPSNGRPHGSTGPSHIPRSRSHERLKVHLTPPPRGSKRSASYRTRGTYSPAAATPSTSTNSPNGLRACSSSSLSQGGSRRGREEKKKYLQGGQMVEGQRRSRRGSESDSTPSPSPILPTKYEVLSSSSAEDGKPKLISKMGKRNIKAQVKRFRMETKAAKTLGIIVGGFIGCWCPFFTIYVIRAFCENECINPLLFSVLFWLGYCNSAINPCIYALFSKDFRFAFKKILCRCLCQREKKKPTQVIPIFLSSLGEEQDSEHEQEDGSDSR